MGQTCVGKIGHVVALPNASPRELPDADTKSDSTWGGVEVERKEEYILSRIKSQPSSYEEDDKFLYMMSDRYGRLLIGISSACFTQLTV